MNFLGLDIGTTKIKCGVINEQGKSLYYDSVDYGEKYTGDEKYLDIEKVKKIVFSLLKKAYKTVKFNSIAVSSLGESFVLLDEKDNVLFLPMLYTDVRGKEQADNFQSQKEEIFKVAGVYPQSMYSAYKLMWIKENKPEVYKKANKLFLINEYVTYLLTGKRVIDYAMASRTGMFDVHKKQFSLTLAEKFGLNIDLFSTPVKNGTVIGDLKQEIVKDWGVNEKLLVVSGGHDQVCASIGAGVTDGNAFADGMGTVECAVAVYDKSFTDVKIGNCGYPNVPFLSNYCTYLLNYSCGSLTRWWLESIFSKEDIISGKAFNEIEKGITDKPTGLLVLPYFSGSANPYQNIDAKGSILNLSLTDTPSKIYQGILEGLSFELKLNLDVVKKIGVKPKKLIATGGGSASKKWLQIKADVLGVKICTLKNKEAGILGSAILGASALLNKDIKEIAKKFVKYESVIKPRKEISELYKKEYKKYKLLYKSLLKFM